MFWSRTQHSDCWVSNQQPFDRQSNTLPTEPLCSVPNFRVLIKENFTATAIVSWAGALFLHATDPFIDTITQAVCTCFTCPLLGYKQYKRISKTDRCSPNKCLLKNRCKLISLIVLMLYSGQNLSITKGNNFSIMQKRILVLGHCISPHQDLSINEVSRWYLL